MSNAIMATKETDLSNLTVYLDEQILQISLAFAEIDRLISESISYFNDDIYIVMKKKYDLLALNYDIIKSNLEGYKDDFSIIRNNYIGYDKAFKTSEVEKNKIEGGEFTGVR